MLVSLFRRLVPVSTSMNRTLAAICMALITTSMPPRVSKDSRNGYLRWMSAEIQAIRESHISSAQGARAFAIVHTCMYDAWAAYDEHATGTQLSAALRRPASERNEANKEKAISYAAYRALTDMLPAETDSFYKPLMKQLGYDPNDKSTDIETPEGIGNVACAAVLEFRHHDKSNQLGDLAQGPYSDWTYFRPVNMPTPFPLRLPTIHPIDMNHWQPLIYVDSTGGFTAQMFTAAQWSRVTPLALTSADEFRGVAMKFPPVHYASPQYHEQAQEIVNLSAGLTDEQKMLAEYWTDAEGNSAAPERWNEFAEWISERDHHSLDDDVRMFFALNNALLDASIATWDMKREFDSVRPVTAIPILFHGTKIRAWGGPGKGTVEMDGADWKPYEPATSPTPASPEYVSETSALSAAAAAILAAWTGNDSFAYSVTIPAASSKIEPGLPSKRIVFNWQTFTDAASDAGMAQRYAGIQFSSGDLAGRELGRQVGAKVWTKAQQYFAGTPNRSAITSAQEPSH